MNENRNSGKTGKEGQEHELGAKREARIRIPCSARVPSPWFAQAGGGRAGPGPREASARRPPNREPRTQGNWEQVTTTERGLRGALGLVQHSNLYFTYEAEVTENVKLRWPGEAEGDPTPGYLPFAPHLRSARGKPSAHGSAESSPAARWPERMPRRSGPWGAQGWGLRGGRGADGAGRCGPTPRGVLEAGCARPAALLALRQLVRAEAGAAGRGRWERGGGRRRRRRVWRAGGRAVGTGL